MRPAGIASILGVLLLAGGLALRITALNADGAAEALLELSDDDLSGRLLLGAVLTALAYLCLAVPLTHLFLAARARAERMRGGLVGVAAVSAAFLAVGGVVSSAALSTAADRFAEAEAEREAAPPEDAASATDSPASGAATAKQDGPGQGSEPAAGAGSAAGGDGKGAKGEKTIEATTTGGDGRPADGGAATEEDPEQAANDRAEDAIRDSPGYGIGGILGVAGTLGFSIAFFYTSLWSMRTGLLTRFWGSLGMASAVVFLLLAQGAPEILVFQELWFLATGLMLLGRWFGGRPPAWESGTAIPWQKPGDQGPPEEIDTLEGEGRDVTGEALGGGESARPEENGSGDTPPSPPPRKRKRRS